MNRAQVMEAIEPVAALGVRNIDHGPHTRIIVGPDQVILRPGKAQRRIAVAEEGVISMANLAGIPINMGKVLSPQTFQRVANEMLEQRGQYNVLTRDNEVVEFAPSGKYTEVSAKRVLDIVERVIPDTEYARALVLPKQTIQVEVIGSDESDAGYGDIVRAGTLISFSPLGLSQPMVQSYVHRMWCRNGAVSDRFLRAYGAGGGGEGDNVWHFFRQSIRTSYRQLSHIVDRWRQMREQEIPADQRAEILEALMKEAGLPQEIREVVRSRAIEASPVNNYEMSQLITWASSHLLTEGRSVQRARAAAARFDNVETHDLICPLCHRQRVQSQ